MSLDALLERLAACRICRDTPQFLPGLPHEPRPVIQASASARLCIAGQAPGTRVHASGKPFTDPSGTRLRGWLGLAPETFHDASRIAIVPMGHCFPGQDAKGGDLPPHWHAPVFAAMPRIELVLLIGGYAQAWHLTREERAGGLTPTMLRWREILAVPRSPRLLPLPHPSWRNNGWLRTHGWFEEELLPVLRAEVRRLIPA
jgi:uracil-DNA glycosylase